MSRQIGIGVVGLGFVGSGAHLPAFKKIENARLVAVSDSNEATLRKQAAKHEVPTTYADYRELVRDSNVDAVLVSVPTQYHAQVALAALAAGKHVLCEMPLAPSLEEVDQILEAAKRAGVILMPSLNFRFTPNYVKAKQLIDQGAIARPTSVMYREFIPALDLAKQWPPGAWVWDLRKSRGPLFTLSVWSIDLMRWLLGTEITDVKSAVSYSPLNTEPELTGYNAFVHYRFENGAIGCLQSSGSVARSANAAVLDVIGSNTRCLRATWHDQLSLLGDDPDRTDWTFRESGGHRVWGHMQMDEHLVDCIARGAEPSVSPADGRRAVEISLKIVES
jgi:myo-inositol 2-dehydrogenase/D-chiro-inositol 1-dehydrogenase/scyllo-inositol 2-dehydrogenase (NAD+)